MQTNNTGAGSSTGASTNRKRPRSPERKACQMSTDAAAFEASSTPTVLLADDNSTILATETAPALKAQIAAAKARKHQQLRNKNAFLWLCLQSHDINAQLQ